MRSRLTPIYGQSTKIKLGFQLMIYKFLPDTLWTQLNKTISEFKKNQRPLVALFDADGTLWDTDLGENFFIYTIDNRLVELPENPWEYYQQLKKQNNDPRAAYLWLAQIYEGQSVTQVQQWANEAFQSLKPFPLFEEQKKLIDFLIKNKVEIKIVTASVSWAVHPGARYLGLDNSVVIGVETIIENGIVSAQPKGVITYRAGKVEAYKQQSQTIPFLASGNSEGDIELLEFASDLRLAVSAANREDRLYKSEYKLQQIAKERNWINHRFI